MKHSIIVSILALTLASTAAPAFAGDKPVPNTNFVIYAPEGEFKLEGTNELLTAENTEKTCSFMWAIAPAKDLDKAAAGLTALVENFVSDIKEGKPQKKTINGLPALIMTATGVEKATKKPLSIMTALVQLDDKVMITIGAVHTDKKAKYKAVAEKVFGGIRKK